MTDPTVYRFYSADGALLYIGKTISPRSRLKSHRHGKDWFGDVSRITIEKHATETDALEAERAAIVAERPVHNVIHNGGYVETGAEAPAPTEPVDPVAGLFYLTWRRCGCCSDILGPAMQGRILGRTGSGFHVSYHSWIHGYEVGDEVVAASFIIDASIFVSEQAWRAAGDHAPRVENHVCAP